jgi:hypothetical protein
MDTVAKHLELKLRDAEGELDKFRRPRMTVEIDNEPYNKDCRICLAIAAQWGHPDRYIELTDMEARQLAAHLLCLADLSQAQAA